MREILVTGSTGFVGRNLLKDLDPGRYKVTTLDRSIYSEGDIETLTKIVSKVDCVVHLAGISRGDATDMMKINLVGTTALIESISRLTEIKPNLVFASTFAVYSPGDSLLDEDSPTEPRNMYGLSKLWAEQVITDYSKRFNISSLILRLSNVYGPDMEPGKHSVVATFVDKIKKGEEITINGDGSQARDFIYIDDVVKAITRTINILSQGEIIETVNICSNESISMLNLVNEISLITGNKAKVVFNASQKESGVWIGKNGKANKIIDWLPSVDFKDGIKRCINDK